MDFESPCQCQRCGWLGTIRDTHELLTEPTQNICPRCATETVVQRLRQKGLDGLREEYRLLPKMSYAKHLSNEERSERMVQLERFFEHIDAPLVST